MGTSRIYAQPYDAVYDASLKVIRHLDGFTVMEENKVKREIIALHGVSAASNGERVAIFLQKIDEQQTRVEVVSKAIIKTHFFATHWEKQIFQLLNMQLEE
jgi:hypothetical protein